MEEDMRVDRPALGGLLCAALALGATACGSDSGTKAAAGSPSGSVATATSSGSGATAAAQAMVAGATPLATKFTAPGPPITGGKTAYAGKTVWYIPVTSVATFFSTETKVQQGLWKKLGVTLRLCDAKVSPTGASTCLRQAVAAKAAAVITDALPVAFAQDAYTAVVDAHIPVVAGFTDASAAPTTGSFAKYFRPVSGEEATTMQLAAANLIVASGGTGNILVAEANDIPSAVAASKAGTSYLHDNCPKCTVASFSVKTVGNPNLASQVSAEILKHPGVKYFFTPYESPSGPVFLQAIRQTGRKLTFTATANDTSGLQRVRDGGQLADDGLDPVFTGWNYVDAALRAIAGMPPVQYKALIRLFTKDTAPEHPTFEGRVSGTWYSDLSYQPLYLKSWGAS
jgi:ribose transport system substrate-binding protein